MVIDFHAHLLPTLEGRERLLRAMRENGIDATVVVAGGVVSPQELSRQIALGGESHASAPNETILELCRTSGANLFPFFFANPHEGVQEYARVGAAYYGLKLAPAIHGVSLGSTRNHALIEVAESLNHAVYLHCLARPGFDIGALLELAANFPRTSFVLGHAGIGNCDFFSVDSIAGQRNIYFETSGGFSSVIGYALKRLGEDRVLFGSEFPLEAPEVELAKYRRLDVDVSRLTPSALKLLGKEVEAACAAS